MKVIIRQGYTLSYANVWEATINGGAEVLVRIILKSDKETLDAMGCHRSCLQGMKPN